MSRPGAFTAVVCSGWWDGPPSFRNYISPEACLPLGPAVLVHAAHRVLTTPVGVAVPWYVAEYFADGGSAIVVDAVFGSRAHAAWSRVQEGSVSLSGIWTGLRWEE